MSQSDPGTIVEAGTSTNTAATPSKVVKLLLHWRNVCSRRCAMHNASRGHFKLLNHALSISSIVLASIAGASTIGIVTNGGSSSSSNDSSSSFTTSALMLAFGASGILASVLQSVHKLLGLAELQREHDLYSDMYANAAREVDLQMVMIATASSSDEKQLQPVFRTATELAKFVKHTMDLLEDRAPPIPARIEARVLEQSMHTHTASPQTNDNMRWSLDV